MIYGAEGQAFFTGETGMIKLEEFSAPSLSEWISKGYYGYFYICNEEGQVISFGEVKKGKVVPLTEYAKKNARRYHLYLGKIGSDNIYPVITYSEWKKIDGGRVRQIQIAKNRIAREKRVISRLDYDYEGITEESRQCRDKQIKDRKEYIEILEKHIQEIQDIQAKQS
jgi:hypothetical protein